LPDSLHGGSSLKAKKIDLKKLGEFEPLKDAVAFKSDETVKIKTAAELEFEFDDETRVAPAGESDAALGPALFLLCKGKAALA
jgi:hypothetical protein